MNLLSQRIPDKTSSIRQEDGNTLRTINVFIITGFLGAGKTTLLNSLLRQFDHEKNIVVENEFGEVNIDKDLVAGNFKKVFEITGGCLCCNLDTELYDVLDQIARMEEKPDNLFLETTGIADAGNLSAIFNEDFVKEVFDLKKMICVTDAEVVEDFLAKTSETARQIAASNLILINKSSKVSSKYLELLEENLKRINPYALFLATVDGTLDKRNLFTENPVKPLFSLELKNNNKELMHSINSVLFETEECFDLEKLQTLLQMSLFIYYQDIYRIKGYIRNQKGEPFILQSAGKTLSIRPAEQHISQSQVILIGNKLTREIADRLLRQAIIEG
ncbi:MAG: GTP-binding protein [Bacteroidetes bacterium]|nr:MAG: GTP-binding protein [Bacteroidota bacterium]